MKMSVYSRVFPSSKLVCVIALMVGFVTTVQAIDCYKCTSINGKTEECEDKFQRDISTFHLIERRCVYGYFQGTHCIKLKGQREDGTRIVVRDCSDGDWGSHCGDIRYLYGDKEQRIQGCLEACDQDGCNSAIAHAPSHLLVILLLPLAAILTFLLQNVWSASLS